MQLVTPQQFASRLQITVKQLYTIARSNPGFPQPIRLTRRTLRWKEADVLAVVNKQEATNEQGN